MLKKPGYFGSFDASVYLEHLKKANVSYKAYFSVMYKSQSFLHAKICTIAS